MLPNSLIPILNDVITTVCFLIWSEQFASALTQTEIGLG